MDFVNAVFLKLLPTNMELDLQGSLGPGVNKLKYIIWSLLDISDIFNTIHSRSDSKT